MPLTTHRCYHRWLAGALLLVLLLITPTAWACTVSPSTSANFGNISSFAITNTPHDTSAQPNAGIVCNGSLLALASNQRITATVSSANAGTLANTASGDAIPFRIFALATENEEIFLNTPYNYFNSVLIDLLGLIGGQSIDIPMEFRTLPTNNVAAGTYTDTLTVNWDWRICDIGLLGICLARTGTDTNTINLSLTVTPDCAIQAPDLNFGSSPLVAGFNPVTQTIDITCTKGSDYSVGLSDGQHPAANIRRMENNGHYLEYQLYKGTTGNDRWGNTGSERRPSSSADTNPGTPSGVTSQGFTYRGDILPGQNTPPAGTYTDMIVVDVIF
ncbi:spore coat U domain-containing protein [Halomonas sp. IOP_6]|uniref:Csu type fimbrial protein n=1 Tax=Halomonas sp. IOP_6 TaxID=2876583 RepID=UPI001E2A3035|nr:spore coat U domain-containing protein [Halomonas sp. IOP_6]MCD6003877.1 spore coat U domain-containing protein [Halomonas sp. IOP_6]